MWPLSSSVRCVPMAKAGMRLKSASAFGLAMAASVAYYFAASPVLLSPASEIASAGATLGAVLFGWLLGSWYVQADDERPSFELVVVPVLVPFASLVFGLAVLTVFAQAAEPQEPRPIMVFGVALGFGFPAFLSIAWPVVLASFLLAGIWLARCSRVAPNYSLKRTNQSLRD